MAGAIWLRGEAAVEVTGIKECPLLSLALVTASLGSGFG